MVYFAHTDFFKYFLYFSKKGKFQDKNKLLKNMLEDLLKISKNKLIIPTYNYDFPNTRIYNVKKDLSQVGSFSEYFRKKYLNSRSLIPMFSTCNSIKNLNFKYKKNFIDPFGQRAEFAYLVKTKGKILSFGSRFGPSFIIYIERCFPGGAPYRYKKIFKGKTALNRKVINCVLSYEVRPKNINILYDIYKIRSELIKNKILNLKKTESGFPYEEIDAFNFLKFGINKMKKNPYYFLTKATIKKLKKLNLYNKKKFKIKDFE